MNPLFVRDLSSQEIKALCELEGSLDARLSRRARLVLLSSEHHHNASELEKMLHMDVSNVCHWIHRFNSLGIAGILPKGHPGRKPKFGQEVRQQIVDLANTSPSDLGKPFKRWTLTKLAGYLMEQGIVDSISHEQVRQIIKQDGDGVEWSVSGPEIAASEGTYDSFDVADSHLLLASGDRPMGSQINRCEDSSTRRMRRRGFNPIRWVSEFLKPGRSTEAGLAGTRLPTNESFHARGS